MSADDGGPGNREVAYRIFAAEYEDADFSYSESDEERAPNYVITPTGARANRVFVVGVLTEKEQVNDDVLRARIVDPTGAFVTYAGQYQPDELAFLERADPPMFVAITGKARTFQPDDSDTVYTSIRPESINEVDAATRDRWVVTTAEQTLDRVSTMASALARDERGEDLAAALAGEGLSEARASGVALAIEHYHTTPTYLQAIKEMALDAAGVVADEVESVDDLTTAPDQEGAATLSDLVDVDAAAVAGSTASTASSASDTGGEPAGESDPEPTAETPSTADTAEADTADAGTDEVATSTDTAPTETPETSTTDDATETASESTTEADTEAPASEPAAPDTSSDTEPATTAETTADADTASAGGEDSTAPGGDAGDETGDDPDDDIGDFEPGEFDLDEEERQEVEEEYGTDFETGNTVEDPGEADIETPDPEDLEAQDEAGAEPDSGTEVAAETEPEPEPESEADSEPEPDPEPEADTASGTAAADETDDDDEAAADETAEDDGGAAAEGTAEDVDLEDAAVEVMGELNGDDGAERDAVIDAVVDRYGADPDDVEDAIQSALMDGRCYEPDDTTLKPI